MGKKELKEKIEKIELKLKEKRKEYSKVGNQLTRLINKLDPLNEKLDEIQCNENDIGYLLEAFPETNVKRKMLRELASQYCLDVGGYWIDNNQSTLIIRLTLDDDEITENTHKGILKFLPYIKPIDLQGKIKKAICFSIKESTLSEFGSYKFIINKDNMTAAIHKISYGRGSTGDWKPIPETLRFVQKQIYYMKTADNYP